ncbi:SMI1/KNR4 family protein [Bacillus toyonensis]|uniref:SMI1/KNR4 family protein n=1 Tax=Bacillus toyonensis TaxID=155322 RepID=UPI000BEDA125|nr:SMI1/KNR4 family protein [Bacillus toyonensis]MCU4969347.1 SMI1/KNR4 family protein [Bacillus toyonensis]PEB16157.1 SMI1/KNR4 family protein [Bacillus toyonensis]PEF98174.1 SMI1/KNR4 family protein [Bacillus toyonensis]PEJ86843.1 SMI1/KNR4 family protein [Bacillus toyonensis]PEL35540.1 SMI1/KNR4 family protein [Bacillus toyonensis]
MKIKNGSELQSPNDELIESFEEYCEIKLPNDFIDFLKKYNGSIPITNVFLHEKNELLIERFLCLLEDPEDDEENGWYDIEVVLSDIDTRLTDDEDLTGINVIPFAVLFAGDFLCLDFREKEIPPVVVWYHEESEELNPVTSEVADNFSEFLSMLKE